MVSKANVEPGVAVTGGKERFIIRVYISLKIYKMYKALMRDINLANKINSYKICFTGITWKIVSTYEPKQCSLSHLQYKTSPLTFTYT